MGGADDQFIPGLKTPSWDDRRVSDPAKRLRIVTRATQIPNLFGLVRKDITAQEEVSGSLT